MSSKRGMGCEVSSASKQKRRYPCPHFVRHGQRRVSASHFDLAAEAWTSVSLDVDLVDRNTEAFGCRPITPTFLIMVATSSVFTALITRSLRPVIEYRSLLLHAGPPVRRNRRPECYVCGFHVCRRLFLIVTKWSGRRTVHRLYGLAAAAKFWFLSAWRPPQVWFVVDFSPTLYISDQARIPHTEPNTR